MDAATEAPSKLGVSGDFASSLPSLQKNFHLLSPHQIEPAKILVDLRQRHLFEHWPEPGVDDEEKKVLMEQVPTGENLTFGDENFIKFEEAKVREAQYAAFVLVAGGLGDARDTME